MAGRATRQPLKLHLDSADTLLEADITLPDTKPEEGTARLGEVGLFTLKCTQIGKT